MKKYIVPEIKIAVFNSETIMTESTVSGGLNNGGSAAPGGTVIDPYNLPYAERVEFAF